MADDKTRGLNLRDIPGLAAMLAVPRWCNWYWRVRNGQKSKVPRIPGTLENARSNDLTGARSYDAARAAALADKGLAGVGWMMLDDLGRVALDLDKCVDAETGETDAWALAVLEAAEGAYRERTPSGTGWRIIGSIEGEEAFSGLLGIENLLRVLADGEAIDSWGGMREARGGAAIEIYHACARYITVTGWDGSGDPGADIGALTRALVALAEEHGGGFGVRRGKEAARGVPGALAGPIEDVVAALEIIPNNDLPWLEWVVFGMAVRNATGGSEEGWEAFEKWSAKSKSHNRKGDDDCRHHWEHWERSPGGRVGIGKLMMAARETVPGWVRPSRRPEAEFEVVEGPEGNGGIPPWAPFGGSGGMTRRRIKITAGELHHLASEGEAAIIASGLPVFQRAMLVRPAIMEMDAADGGKTQVTGLHRLDVPGILDLFCQTGEWMRFDKGLKKDVKATPPEIVAKVLLSRAGEWNVPYLRGIIAHPTIRHDGTLLDRNGYDPVSGYYLALPPGLNVPSISEKPSRGECVAALESLAELLSEFPFIEDKGASHSVALSLLMTAVVRAAMEVAPIHGATAPIRGSGKSFLYDIAGAIVYGGRCPVIYAGNSSDELEKKLNGLLLQGATLFSIDNLNIPLEGDLICQIATQPTLDLRRLGRSDMYRTPNSALAGVTGNNLVVMEDVTRRVVMASMDAEVERPEKRKFKSNPFQRALKDRGRYLAAILTIVRGYMASSGKAEIPPLGSFDDYTRFVREPLVWLGQTDPADTMETLHEADPVMALLRNVMATWEAAVGLGVAKTAAEVIDMAQNPSREFETTDEAAAKERVTHRVALGEAIAAVSKNGAKISPQELGHWLRHHAGGISDGRRFTGKTDSKRNVQVWSLTMLF